MIKSGYVADFLRDNNAIYWKVRLNNDKGHMLTSYPIDSETPTLDGSLVYFNRILNRLMAGRYFIEAWQTEGQKKEWNKTFFEVEGSGSESENKQMSQYFAGIGNIPNENIDDKIAKALTDYKKDQEIETLKAKVNLLENEKKDLQLEIDSAQARIMKRLNPYLPELMEGLGFTKTQEGIAGAGEIDIDSEALSKNLKDWYDVDDEMPDLVSKILNIAKNNKNTYQMAKNMLMSQ